MQNHSKLTISFPWSKEEATGGLESHFINRWVPFYSHLPLWAFLLLVTHYSRGQGLLPLKLCTSPRKSSLAFSRSSACTVGPPGIAFPAFTPWWTDLLHLLKTLWVWSNWDVRSVFDFSILLLKQRPKKGRNSTLSGWAADSGFLNDSPCREKIKVQYTENS